MMKSVMNWVKQWAVAKQAGKVQQQVQAQPRVAERYSMGSCVVRESLRESEPQPARVQQGRSIKRSALFHALMCARKQVEAGQLTAQAYAAFYGVSVLALQAQVEKLLEALHYEVERLAGPRNIFTVREGGSRYLVVFFNNPASLKEVFERRIGLKQVTPVLGQAKHLGMDGVMCIATGGIGSGVYEAGKDRELIVINGIDLWRLLALQGQHGKRGEPSLRAA